ncbi:MAG: hypothetical protein ACXADY_27340 [Candidatus Hodarchaeales archaeon]
MSRRASRVDKNQPELVEWLRNHGYSVALTHMVGKNFPDIVIAKFGKNVLIEIKSEKGKLSEGQEKFASCWQGAYACVNSLEELKCVLKAFFGHLGVWDE